MPVLWFVLHILEPRLPPQWIRGVQQRTETRNGLDPHCGSFWPREEMYPKLAGGSTFLISQ